jgi:hypothetical protein
VGKITPLGPGWRRWKENGQDMKIDLKMAAEVYWEVRLTTAAIDPAIKNRLGRRGIRQLKVADGAVK